MNIQQLINHLKDQEYKDIPVHIERSFMMDGSTKTSVWDFSFCYITDIDTILVKDKIKQTGYLVKRHMLKQDHEHDTITIKNTLLTSETGSLVKNVENL